MKTEKQVRDACLRIAKKRGVFHKRMHFGRGAARGWPDDLFLHKGRHLWIEFKRPNGLATELQLATHDEMRRQGASVYVVDGVDSFCVALGVLGA
jgi:hypothetical protein